MPVYTNRNFDFNKKPKRKKGGVLSLLIIGAIIFGGYTFYTKTSSNEPQDKLNNKKEEIIKTSRTIDLGILNANSNLVSDIGGEDIQIDQETLPGFVSVNNNQLTFQPTLSDIGEYTFNVSTKKEDLEYKIKIELNEVDIVTLKTDVEEILGSELSKYSIYVYDFKRDQELKINADEIKYPASVSKVPYAILTLQNVDKGEINLDSTYPITAGYKAYSSDPMYHFATNSKQTFATYLDYLIKESDNTAMMHLEYYLGGVNTYNQKVQNDLSFYLLRDPHETTAADVGTMLRGIYNQEYLSKEMNDYLLDLMFNTASRFDDRIVAGVENYSEAKVAHKIGQITTQYGMAYHDAGIVYGKYTDFAIVILNQDVTMNSVQNKIPQIVDLIYSELNN